MKYKVQRTLENYQELNDWANDWAKKHKTNQIFTKKNDFLFYNPEKNSLEGGEMDYYKDYQFLSFEEFKSRFMTEKKYTVDYCKNNPVGIHISHHDQLEGLLKSGAIGSIVDTWKLINTPYYIIPHSEKCAPYKDWNGIGDYKKKRVQYELIDFQTFIEHNKEKMEETKEIRGYKLKEEHNNLKFAAAVIVSHTSPYQVTDMWTFSLRNYGFAFSIASTHKVALEKAGVLDIWFEPVYKESEKTLTLSNGKTVVVGKGKIVAEGTTLNKSDLIWLLHEGDFAVKSWKVELKDATYKIGCWENVKLSDIKLIISEYEKLNN